MSEIQPATETQASLIGEPLSHEPVPREISPDAPRTLSALLPSAEIPSVSVASVRRANFFFGAPRVVRFTWDGQPAELRFRAPGPWQQESWRAMAGVGDYHVHVSVDRLPEPSQLSAELAGLELRQLPPDLACGVLEACLEPVWTQLTRAGIEARLVELCDDEKLTPVPEERLEWVIARGSEPAWMRGVLWGDPEALDYLAALIHRVPPERGRAAAQLPFSVSLAAAATTLRIAELRQIEIGDLILADLAAWQSESRCAIYAGTTQVAVGAWRQGAVTVGSLTPIMPDPLPLERSQAALATDDLPVQITFVVGETTLTVQQLQGLQPGFAFELPSSGEPVVSIRANGRNFARGEFLEIAGRTGVRITEIIP